MIIKLSRQLHRCSELDQLRVDDLVNNPQELTLDRETSLQEIKYYSAGNGTRIINVTQKPKI